MVDPGGCAAGDIGKLLFVDLLSPADRSRHQVEMMQSFQKTIGIITGFRGENEPRAAGDDE